MSLFQGVARIEFEDVMKKFILKCNALAIFFAFISGNALAFEIKDFVVKTRSQMCSDPIQKLSGSGLVFNKAGQTYVITSEHVILQELSEVCHFASNETLGELKLELIHSRWDLGLALLKVSAKVLQAPELEELFSQKASIENRIRVLGYPVSENSLRIDQNGKILTLESKRHIFERLDNVIEISGVHVEYGMSGGALFDQSTRKYLGLISHQALALVPGNSPSLQINQEDNKGNINVSNILLAINSKDILKFINNSLSQSEKFTSWKRNFADQLKQIESVSWGQVQLKLLSHEKKNLNILLASMGGDGVGTGGLEKLDVEKTLQVKLLSSGHSQVFSEESPYEWLKNKKSLLLRKNEINIRGIISGTISENNLHLQPVKSLSQFLRSVAHREWTPLIKQSENEILIPSQVVSRANAISEQILKLKISDEAQSLMNQITMVLSLVSQGDAALLKEKDFNSIVNSKHWSDLFSNEQAFDLTVELKGNLIQIIESLKSQMTK